MKKLTGILASLSLSLNMVTASQLSANEIPANTTSAKGNSANKVQANGTIAKRGSVSATKDVILHAWNWSADEIAANAALISDAGFTIVQTAPMQNCLTPRGGNKKLFSAPGEDAGNWYHYYQPTDWKIGNDIIGDKESISAMIDSLHGHGIRVIVDVCPQHTAFDIDEVSDEFLDAVGGRVKMYHSTGLSPIADYNDRSQCTLQGVGGLPDVNTENPDFQKYYLNYVNDLIGMGVDGFRYDTAKHIGVHSDPVDGGRNVRQNDFWDVATGRKAVKGTRLAVPADSLFIYAEVLQDWSVPEEEYGKYARLIASNYGYVMREMLGRKSARGLDLEDWRHSLSPDRFITWVESHDTYCNDHESAGIPDEAIRCGWVFLTARDGGIPLFYSRPNNSTRENYWGDNINGKRGNDEFFHPEVRAVNRFRRLMAWQSETLSSSESGEVISVERGGRGIAVINLCDEARFVDLPVSLPDGNYHDEVYGKEFLVKDGRLSGTATPHRSYIIYSRK